MSAASPNLAMSAMENFGRVQARRVVACALGLLILLACRESTAAGFDLVPEGVWWRSDAPTFLGVSPREALATPRVRLETEWWPLYADDGGARLEGARRSVMAVLPIAHSRPSPWSLRAGAELLERFTVARSGAGDRGFGLEETRERRASLGVAADAGRFGLALSTNAGVDGPTGFALGGRAELAPRWWASVDWSQTTSSGRGSARWDDVRIEATGTWHEQKVDATVAGAVGVVSARLQLESCDRVAITGREHDGVDPGLAWRAARIAVGSRTRGFRWQLDAVRGSGRQTLSVAREGATYGSASGPAKASALMVRVAPFDSRTELRATVGTWDAQATGFLATWPFEALTAATGTRLVASSHAVLEHQGLQLDRLPRGAAGWDGGLAVWHVSPQVDYRSWRATFMALGRDDYREESDVLPEVWLVGMRLALAFAPSGIPMRLECVQWVPAAVERKSSESATPGPPGPDPASPTHGGSATGGTIIRFRIGV
jgi:hypothetical protein